MTKKETCNTCSGTGLVDNDDTEETGLQIQCPDCDGKGYTES
jgi:DnaJ-class molecular chaperone